MQVTCPDGVYLPALGRNVDAGETIDLPDEHAASLIEQGWRVPKDGGPTKADLLDIASAAGVDVKKSWTAADIAAAIEAAAAEPDPATADEQED